MSGAAATEANVSVPLSQRVCSMANPGPPRLGTAPAGCAIGPNCQQSVAGGDCPGHRYPIRLLDPAEAARGAFGHERRLQAQLHLAARVRGRHRKATSSFVRSNGTLSVASPAHWCAAACRTTPRERRRRSSRSPALDAQLRRRARDANLDPGVVGGGAVSQSVDTLAPCHVDVQRAVPDSAPPSTPGPRAVPSRLWLLERLLA